MPLVNVMVNNRAYTREHRAARSEASSVARAARKNGGNACLS
jgi:hypothetical protein